MRRLTLSIGASTCMLGLCWAQNGESSSAQQLPVGQTDKHFYYPIYDEGLLKVTITAGQATGKTQNRAETTDLKIQLYENGVVTTTITSPKADLYLNTSDDGKERKMRTKDTVKIVRADMEATAQNCDFDQINKKYLMRTNVKVILKGFDVGSGASMKPDSSSSSSSTPHDALPTDFSTPSPSSSPKQDSLLDSPGSYSNTNSAPMSPTSPDSK